MQNKTIKTLPVLASTLAIGLMTSCENTDQTYVTTVQRMASEGLNLQAVTDLSTKVKTASEFEKELNKPNNTINNLDLNKDQEIDFIKVTEINDASGKGFSLTTEVEPNEEQELATIQFEVDPESKVATVQATGNQQVYGNNYHYHNSMGVGNLLIWGYLLSSHRPFSSPWGHNRYPDYHQRKAPVSHSKYKESHRNKPYSKNYASSNKSIVKKPLASPNYNKTAKKIKAPLRNPTQSQKTFQKSPEGRVKPKGRGFGGKSRNRANSKNTSQPTKASRTSSSRRTSPIRPARTRRAPMRRRRR